MRKQVSQRPEEPTAYIHAMHRTTPPHTVSGFSAGGSLAINHLFAFSSRVEGAGVLGGSPFGCSTLPDYDNTCSGMNDDGITQNFSIPWDDYVPLCNAYARRRATASAIDPLAYLANKRVYLFSGTRDNIVYQPVMRAVEAQLRNATINAAVLSRFEVATEHAWVVDPGPDTCASPGRAVPGACCGAKAFTEGTCPPMSSFEPLRGGCCGTCAAGAAPLSGDRWWWPPINGCAGVDVSGEMLHYLLPSMDLRRKPPQLSNLIRVNQSALLPAGWDAASALVDSVGFVYMPRQCANATSRCAVHVHYHPCDSSWRKASGGYMLYNGLASLAEGSGLVIVFPQAADGGLLNGCWDWYGATGRDSFDTNRSVQLNLAMAMLDHLPTLAVNRPISSSTHS